MAQRTIEQRTQSEETRCVVVIYENPAVREHAAHFCDRLMEQHSWSSDLEVHWWSFPVISHKSGDTVGKAAAADLVVFAISAVGDLPREVKIWIERWLGKRGDREGALVGLLERDPNPGDVASIKEMYLRHAAHRGGMDYLSHTPPTRSKAIPDSIDSFNQRAGQVTSVLDQILHTPLRPTPPL